MTIKELSDKLEQMYKGAQKNEKVTMIHLFGIKYHTQIKEVGVQKIIEQSGMPSSYHTEISKGVKLAKYVKVMD